MLNIITKSVCLILIFNHMVIGQTAGFFKDIFVDGGVHLTGMINFPAAEGLDLSVEYLATDAVSAQTSAMITNAYDSNGHLLYPDREPRFRLLYTNGGSSTSHGTSLEEEGRRKVRTFYKNGGSFMGSCAGAYIASVHWDSTGQNEAYYRIWPGRTGSTGLIDSHTDHDIPADSPLLNYFDFGGDLLIANVRHNGGCWAREDLDFPIQTEILARYNIPNRVEMHGKASTWAYKPDDNKGRIVVIGSHPEFESGGEKLDLAQAMLLYSLAGVGSPHVKAELNSAEPRVMDQFYEDNNPDFTRIGDKQYHHFTVDVPPGTDSLTIELDAESGFDFNLYANPDNFAFKQAALFTCPQEGSNHKLILPTPQSGIWYIGVECATTVSSANTIYWGKTEVLNGVAYTIKATWDTTAAVGISDAHIQPSEFRLNQNYPNPFNPSTTIGYSIPEISDMNLTIYDVSGRTVLIHNELQQSAGHYNFHWNGTDARGLGVPTGVYFVRLEAGEHSKTIKMVYMK